MKKIKIFALFTLVIALILTILCFVKLPINILTNEKIENETYGLINLKAYEKQSLLILPTPKIELVNSVFTLNHNLLEAQVSIPSIDLSRSLFREDHFSIKLKKAFLKNVSSNFLNNSILLEDEVENLSLKIINENNLTEIKSNEFKYKGAKISFNAYLENSSLKKLSFSIDGLEIDEFILLLDEKFQKYLKKISFSSLDIKGEYTSNSFIIQKLDLNLKDESKINLLGFVDIQNVLNSDLQISGSKISTKNIIQLIENLNLGFEIKSLPKGILETFNLKYDKGLFELNNLSYQSNLGTNISLQGEVKNSNISDSNLKIELKSSSSKEVLKFLKEVPSLKNLPLIQFEEIYLDSLLSEGLFKINALKIINGDSDAEINGYININDIDDRNLRINLTNFEQLNLIPLPQLKKILTNLGLENINLDCVLLGTDLEINYLDIFFSEESMLKIAGDVNFKNFEETFLNIEFENLNSDKIRIILDRFNQINYMKYIDMINFEEMRGNFFLDQKNNSILIDNIELTYQDIITGNLSGDISNKKFKGLVDIQEIDISEIDKNFFKSGRVAGLLNIDLEIPNLISSKNYMGISGLLKGDIKINVSNDELALLFFIQTLSEDIEDFNQEKELLEMLSKSFINQTISLAGNISNEIQNKIHIKDLTLTATNGDNLMGEFEYYGRNYKLTIFNVIDRENLVIKYEDGIYHYERIIPDGTVKKPIEELIKKNINKLFENLLQ